MFVRIGIGSSIFQLQTLKKPERAAFFAISSLSDESRIKIS